MVTHASMRMCQACRNRRTSENVFQLMMETVNGTKCIVSGRNGSLEIGCVEDVEIINIDAIIIAECAHNSEYGSLTQIHVN